MKLSETQKEVLVKMVAQGVGLRRHTGPGACYLLGGEKVMMTRATVMVLERAGFIHLYEGLHSWIATEKGLAEYRRIREAEATG